MPTGDIYHQLANLIMQLSKEYSAPLFEPHVTLLTPIFGLEDELVDKAPQLAKIIKPYEIKLATIDYLDSYFRCLFLRAEETMGVMEANTKAKEIFHSYNIDPQDASYTPHLSLMYGDFPLETKKSIVAKIGKELRLNFKAESIHLFFTTGEVKDWYRVKEFRMKYK